MLPCMPCMQLRPRTAQSSLRPAQTSPDSPCAAADSTSDAFNSVVAPFSARVKDLSLGKKAVPGCSNAATAQTVGAPVTSPNAVTNAGRKLLVSSSPKTW